MTTRRIKIFVSLGLLACAILFFNNQSFGQAGAKRLVKGRILTSDRMPEIRLKFGRKFKYAGSQSFILYNNSQVEQHYFIRADRRKNIRQIYTVQFEGFLPDNNKTYNYDSIKETISLGGASYLKNFIFGRPENEIRERPDSDTARRWKFLAEKGYILPAEAIGQRFVRLLDEAKRNEILIIYHEDLKNLGTTEAELDKPESAEKLKRVFSEVEKHALEGFKVL